MFARLYNSLRRDRRGATAIIIALMSIPLIISSGVAVDFSRVSSARAQLQSAVDAAALAGVGAYQVNKDGTVAYNVANTAFNTATTNLNLYSAITSTVGTVCNASGTATCGTTRSPNGTATLCPGTTVYCVEVTAQATLQNSLLAIVIPSDVLNVTSVAQSTGISVVGSPNIAHAGNGYGSDAVLDALTPTPTDSAGNPIYGSPTAPNTNCQNSAYGILQYLPTSTPASGVTTCNYVIIGTNSGTSGNGSFGFSNTDPLTFTLETFSGGNITTGTSDLDTTTFNSLNGVTTVNLLNAPTPYYNELYVTVLGSTTYYPTGNLVSGIAEYAYCPAHNLYGSILAYPNSNPSNNIVPYQDSIHVFSSSWMVVGYPPTHSTNNAILPFLGPANNTIAGLPLITVRAICPQWPRTGTNITATATFTPSNLNATLYAPVTSTAGYPTASNVPVYSTYYPDVTYTGTNGTYPPEIAGCTPATGVATGGGAADNPWWGWSPYNNYQLDPGGAAENPGGLAETDCTTTKISTVSGLMTYTSNATQTSAYNNCTLIIQPLGSNVPTTSGIPNLPDYYTYVENTSAFNGTSGTTGNPSGIVSSQTLPLVGMTPVYDGTGNTHAAGYVPTAVSITTGNPYTVTEPPAFGKDNYPPEDTSHQCYNPQANGINGTTLSGNNQPNNDAVPVTPIDPVENPQLGAVLCNATPPQSYAIYWNDMGAYAQPPRYNDDLGYANAFTEFTCPTPGTPGATGPPALID